MHLRQLTQVEAELLWRTDPIFDSRTDQIEAITLTLPGEHLALEHLCEVILFYASRYSDSCPVIPISLHFEERILELPTDRAEVLGFLESKRPA